MFKENTVELVVEDQYVEEAVSVMTDQLKERDLICNVDYRITIKKDDYTEEMQSAIVVTFKNTPQLDDVFNLGVDVSYQLYLEDG
jgi:hypothetical protein